MAGIRCGSQPRDENSNPVGEGKTGSRFSDAITIDNTPPVIGDLKAVQTKDGAEISLRIVDRIGTVAGVDYAVDASDDWQAANASDMLYDSPDETVEIRCNEARTRTASGNGASGRCQGQYGP